VYIGWGGGGKKIRERDEANARLIAASPDLLEACKQSVITLDPMDNDHAVLWRLLTEAIAKAEGR